jgi:hypothetical protein
MFWEEFIMPTSLKYFSLYGQASKNSLLIHLSVLIFTSTDSNYIKFVRYNLRVLHCHHVSNCICM